MSVRVLVDDAVLVFLGCSVGVGGASRLDAGAASACAGDRFGCRVLGVPVFADGSGRSS